MVPLGRPGPLLAEVGVLCDSCPAPPPLFPFLGMEWDGRDQGEGGRAWHLPISSPNKVRARLGPEPGAASVTLVLSHPEVACMAPL